MRPVYVTGYVTRQSLIRLHGNDHGCIWLAQGKHMSAILYVNMVAEPAAESSWPMGAKQPGFLCSCHLVWRFLIAGMGAWHMDRWRSCRYRACFCCKCISWIQSEVFLCGIGAHGLLYPDSDCTKHKAAVSFCAKRDKHRCGASHTRFAL